MLASFLEDIITLTNEGLARLEAGLYMVGIVDKAQIGKTGVSPQFRFIAPQYIYVLALPLNKEEHQVTA